MTIIKVTKENLRNITSVILVPKKKRTEIVHLMNW